MIMSFFSPFTTFSSLCALTFSFSLLDYFPSPSLFLTLISMAFKKVIQPKILGELDQPEVRTVTQSYISHN